MNSRLKAGFIWNGIFKSYTVVQIIPIAQMTKEDWEILDWDNLRNRAKNRIAEKLEDLAGFAMVRIFNKAKAKPRYLLPMTEEEAEDFDKTGEVPFGNEPDDLDLSPRANDLDTGMSDLLDIILIAGAVAYRKWLKDQKQRKELRRRLDRIRRAQRESEFWNDIDKVLARWAAQEIDQKEAHKAIYMVAVRHLGYAGADEFMKMHEDYWFEDEFE